MSATLPPPIQFDFEAIELHARLKTPEEVDKMIENLLKLKPILADTIAARSAAETPCVEGVNPKE